MYSQIMTEAYSCTFADCGMVFSKEYELKKHMVAHEDPDRVFYCPDCDFITLQKKNLHIHRSAHTGEKTHQCPEMVYLDGSPESPPYTARCEYRTNDPAALTKHRKKVHGYIPPISRSEPAKVAVRKRHQKKDGKVSHPRPPKGPLRRKPSRVVRQAHNATSGAGYTSTSSESSKDSSSLVCWENGHSMGSDTSDVSGHDSAPSARKEVSYEQPTNATCSKVSGHKSSPFLWQGDFDAYGRPVKQDFPFMSLSGLDPSTLGDATSMSPHPKTEQHSFNDPLLHSQWMYGCSTFDQPTQAVPPPIPTGLLMPTDQADYLFPKWIADTGFGGWDRSVLGPPDQLYTSHA